MATTIKSESVPIQSSADVVALRQKVRAWATELKFSLVDQTKMVTAASELGRNALGHGGGGTCLIESLTNGARSGLRLTFEDRGPGILDIQLALKHAYSTAGAL